jgi:hypothetical protein
MGLCLIWNPDFGIFKRLFMFEPFSKIMVSIVFP